MEMDDGFRVRSDITSEGVIVYEFPEVRYRAELDSVSDHSLTAGDGPTAAI